MSSPSDLDATNAWLFVVTIWLWRVARKAARLEERAHVCGVCGVETRPPAPEQSDASARQLGSVIWVGLLLVLIGLLAFGSCR